MTIEEFEKLICAHDYYYNYSDDNSVWEKGRKERERIKGLIEQNPEFRKIWHNFVKEHKN